MKNLLIIFHPIIFFAESLHAKNGSIERKIMAWYGILGILAIAGFIAAYFVPKFYQKALLIVFGSITYLDGLVKLHMLSLLKSLSRESFVFKFIDDFFIIPENKYQKSKKQKRDQDFRWA